MAGHRGRHGARGHYLPDVRGILAPPPASDGEVIAPALNGLRRFVFSRSLKNAPWGACPAATIESGDAVEAIRRIKREVEGTVVLWGSLTLSEVFFTAGEVDAVRLVVMPIALGAGRGVFPAGQDPTLLPPAERHDLRRRVGRARLHGPRGALRRVRPQAQPCASR